MENLSIFKDKMIVTWNLNGWLPITERHHVWTEA